MKWEDVDFENSCVFVRRSLAHVVGKGAVFQALVEGMQHRGWLYLPRSASYSRDLSSPARGEPQDRAGTAWAFEHQGDDGRL